MRFHTALKKIGNFNAYFPYLIFRLYLSLYGLSEPLEVVVGVIFITVFPYCLSVGIALISKNHLRE